MDTKKKVEKCPRCSGSGHLEAFHHVAAGVCFRCWGTGQDLLGAIFHTKKALQQARSQWRALKAQGAPRSAFKSLEVRGKALANHLANLQSTLHSHRQTVQSQRKA